MNKAEILMETIEYYGKDPSRRGVRKIMYKTQNQQTMEWEEKERSSCEYAVRNGETKYCAVGRCLKDEVKDWVVDVGGDISELIQAWWQHAWDGGHQDYDYMEEEEEFYMDDMLDSDYQGHEVEFWNALQSLHDDDNCWQNEDEPGYLTEKGHGEAGDILAKFISGKEYETAYANLTSLGREQ